MCSMVGSTTNHTLPSGCGRWLAVLIGLLAAICAGAALRAVYTPPDIAALVSLPLPLEFTASMTWGLLSALVTITLIRCNPRALTYSAWLLIGLIVYNLARLVLFVRADYDQQRLPFLFALAIIILLVLTAFVLRPSRVATHPTENPGNGRRPED